MSSPQIYTLNITFEKCSSSMRFLSNLANVWTVDHPAALFICLMDKPLRWQCEVEPYRLNVIQTLLYQHLPAEVLTRTIWKELK